MSKLRFNGPNLSPVPKVRDNPWYKKNIASLSRLMKDRRTRPMDDAVWLVEYVARTKGAEHLKVNSRHLGENIQKHRKKCECCPGPYLSTSVY